MRKRERDNDGFRPARGLAGPFRQTVVGALWPARYPRGLPPAIRREVVMHDGERLGALVTPAHGRARGRVVLLHGLGGSADSRYMLRTLGLAWSRGFEVARVQFRGAEDDRPYGPSFHNAGRSDDLAAVLDGLEWISDAGDAPLLAIGFSLGGAVLLRHLGETGGSTRLSAAAAVSAPLDLAACLAELERPRNRLYHLYYVRRLRGQVRAALSANPGAWPALDRTITTIRRIDTRYVAPDAGYDSAEAYYRGASSLPLLSSVSVPTLLLSSRDDPFIPASMFASIPENGAPIETLMTDRGGHVGYIARGGAQSRFWAAEAALDWMESRVLS